MKAFLFGGEPIWMMRCSDRAIDQAESLTKWLFYGFFMVRHCILSLGGFSR